MYGFGFQRAHTKRATSKSASENWATAQRTSLCSSRCTSTFPARDPDICSGSLASGLYGRTSDERSPAASGPRLLGRSAAAAYSCTSLMRYSRLIRRELVVRSTANSHGRSCSSQRKRGSVSPWWSHTNGTTGAHRTIGLAVSQLRVLSRLRKLLAQESETRGDADELWGCQSDAIKRHGRMLSWWLQKTGRKRRLRTLGAPSSADFGKKSHLPLRLLAVVRATQRALLHMIAVITPGDALAGQRLRGAGLSLLSQGKSKVLLDGHDGFREALTKLQLVRRRDASR